VCDAIGNDGWPITPDPRLAELPRAELLAVVER
jgi:hypothetical protein